MNTFLQRVHQIDTLAFVWLHVTRRFPYRKSVRWISRAGDGPLYAAIALGLVLFEAPGSLAFLWSGLVCYALDVSAYLLIKNLIKRDRPSVKIANYQSWITPSDQFSFPSGHTAGAFVFAYLVASFFPLFAIPAYMLATLIGVSRVLLGVHYPSDIIAGALLGSLAAIAGSALYAGVAL